MIRYVCHYTAEARGHFVGRVSETGMFMDCESVTL